MINLTIISVFWQALAVIKSIKNSWLLDLLIRGPKDRLLIVYQIKCKTDCGYRGLYLQPLDLGLIGGDFIGGAKAAS